MLFSLVFILSIVLKLVEGAPWSLASWLWPNSAPPALPTVVHHMPGHHLPVALQNNSGSGAESPNETNITGILQQNSTFSVFTSLLNRTGYFEKLGVGNVRQAKSQTKNIGVGLCGLLFLSNSRAYIPEAFESLPSWITQSFQNGSVSPAILRSLVAYHIHNATAPLPLPQNTTTTAAEVARSMTVRSHILLGARVLLQQQHQNSSVGTWGTVPNATAPCGGAGAAGNYTSVSSLLSWANLTYYVNSTTGQPFVNDAAITSQANATNGRIYGINRVISPLWYFNTSLYSITNPPPPPPVSGPIPGGANGGGSGNTSAVVAGDTLTSGFGMDGLLRAFGVIV
ncbi:hypothetical protein BJ742DRAFT_737327 [Cladochytrium replicatum]|nr:hypothetical protein BJ742DRAFT_737327 [Cladochytrium replicatum]